MSRTVTIPKIGADPCVIRVGGQVYSYKAGSTQTVPDAVADVIENIERMLPATDPEIADKQYATIGDVKKLIESSGGGSSDDSKFVVTIRDNPGGGYIVDKTVAGINAAYTADKVVVVQYNGNEYDLVTSQEAVAAFSQSYFNSELSRTEIVTIFGIFTGENDVWQITTQPVADTDIHVPFTLTLDAQTGEITGTTTASFAEVLAAKLSGKTVIAEATLVVGTATQVFSGVMSGASVEGQPTAAALYTTVVGAPRNGGTIIPLQQLAWNADGAEVKPYNIAVSS